VTITINGFDQAEIRSAINQLKKLQAKNGVSQNACMAVAEYGAKIAQREFSFASYDGVNDVRVTANPTELGAEVRASGNATLFIEYGSGATFGYGHPNPGRYGPGTWSKGPLGKGHWDNPNGWYYAHGIKSRGNPPAAAMYHAETEMYYHAYDIVNGAMK
jgi:hypothetical protein